jgi:predicted GNAT family acetyltransferase
VTTSSPESDLIDVERENRFVFEENGYVAELVYQVEDGRLILIHTGVPEELGGRGIAGRLARAAIDKAVREHLTVVPWCPFARRWLHDHPEVAETVKVDWQSFPPPHG